MPAQGAVPTDLQVAPPALIVAGHPAAAAQQSAPRPANIQQALVVRLAEGVLLLTVVALAPLAPVASRVPMRRVLVDVATVSPATLIPAPSAAARPPTARAVAAVILPAATVRRALELTPVPSDPDALALNPTEASAPHEAGLVPTVPDVLAPNTTEASAPHGADLVRTALVVAPDSARLEASGPSAPTAAELIL